MTQTINRADTGRPVAPAETSFSPLLITFLMKRSGREMHVRCRGCREIMVPTNPLPGQFRGLIDLDEQPVPVIDATARFSTEETQISASSCIVVIDREYGSQRVRIGDIDEVMQLAAGTGTASPETGISANMDLVVKMFDTPNPQELLAERQGGPGFLHATHNHILARAVQA